MAFLHFDPCWQLIWEWSIKSEKWHLTKLRVLVYCQHRWLIVILLSSRIKRIHWFFKRINTVILYSPIKWQSAFFIFNLYWKGSDPDRDLIRSFSFQVDNEKIWSPLYLWIEDHDIDLFWRANEYFRFKLRVKWL